jgi:hypothetical protein
MYDIAAGVIGAFTVIFAERIWYKVLGDVYAQCTYALRLFSRRECGCSGLMECTSVIGADQSRLNAWSLSW